MTDLRRGIDGRHVDTASRLPRPCLRHSSARPQAPDLSDLFPHRASPSTGVSFKPEGSLSRRIETKRPIRKVLERIVDVKQRFAESHSKTPEGKGRLLDSVSRTVHDALFTAHQCSGDPDSNSETDPVTDGLEFKAYVTSLHQYGRQARLDSRTHSNSDFRGALYEITRIYSASHDKTTSLFGLPPNMSDVQQPTPPSSSSNREPTRPMSGWAGANLRGDHDNWNGIVKPGWGGGGGMPPPGWDRAEATAPSSPSPTLERLRAASFSPNNVSGPQGLIVDPGYTVSVEPTTKHTIKVYKLHFVRLIKMGTTDTHAERIGISMYVFFVEQEQSDGLRC